MPRLFIAIRLSEEAAFDLERLTRGLPAARWTDADDYHLTLRFVGEVEPATFYEIGETLADISLPPFDLTLKGIGQFPPRGPLKHLWAGVEPNEGLARLKRRIDRVVAAAGAPPEARKWVPHVTLGRFRSAPPEHRLASWLAARNLFKARPFPVSSFGLYSSHLGSYGADHVLEAEYDFVTGTMERV